jgi:hypothetical protein
MRFPKKKPSAAFYFVIDHLLGCLPSAESLWHEASPSLSKTKHFNINKPVGRKRVHQN